MGLEKEKAILIHFREGNAVESKRQHLASGGLLLFHCSLIFFHFPINLFHVCTALCHQGKTWNRKNISRANIGIYREQSRICCISIYNTSE